MKVKANPSVMYIVEQYQGKDVEAPVIHFATKYVLWLMFNIVTGTYNKQQDVSSLSLL